MKYLKILSILWLLTGCAAAVPAIPALSGLIPSRAGTQVLTSTTINISRGNYKIVKTNANGSSVGFSFLGLFTFISPHYHEALTNLYKSGGYTEGKAQAVINVVFEQSASYYILFALPKITVCADIIEFSSDAAPTNQKSN